MSARRADGALAILLHTHMPYVEGFGTWPFGEEWLWEAMATCYLPLLELLDAGAPLTLSLTPVLCDQLEAGGVAERFTRFVAEVRGESHRKDIDGLRAGGYPQLAAELQRSYGDYERAARRLADRGGDLLAALAPHAQWTSAATHAVLPLLASDAGIAVQVRAGVDSHRARFGPASWRGGFWLPECAHAEHVEAPLAAAGVRACCVELTGRPGGFALGSAAHLRPLRSESGLTLMPIDRQTISLVWSEGGYPADGAYRDYHRHTVHHHNPWGNDGSPYDHERALARAHTHAADFVARTRARLAAAADDAEGVGRAGHAGGGPLAVCALDTELLGHWWYEGVAWLEAVVEECAAQGLALVRLDEALAEREPVSLPRGLDDDGGRGRLGGAGAAGEAAEPGASGATGKALGTGARAPTAAPSSWGRGGDLSTWSGPAVAEIAFAARAAELRVLAAGERAGAAAVRELMALQSSDWAFMVSRGLAVPYARERVQGHLEGVRAALAAGPGASAAGLRNLAVHADAAGLRGA